MIDLQYTLLLLIPKIIKDIVILHEYLQYTLLLLIPDKRKKS